MQSFPRGHFPPFLYITHIALPRTRIGTGLGTRSSSLSSSVKLGLTEVGEDEPDETEDSRSLLVAGDVVATDVHDSALETPIHDPSVPHPSSQ